MAVPAILLPTALQCHIDLLNEFTSEKITCGAVSAITSNRIALHHKFNLVNPILCDVNIRQNSSLSSAEQSEIEERLCSPEEEVPAFFHMWGVSCHILIWFMIFQFSPPSPSPWQSFGIVVHIPVG